MNKKILAVMLSIALLTSFYAPANAIEKKLDYRTVEKIDKAVEKLSDKKVSVRRQAKKDLIKWGDLAVEPLLAVVKDWRGKDADLRVLCVDILGEIKDDRAVPVIISVLEEKKMTMRYNAARALGKIGDNKAVPALIKLLKDSEWEVRFFTAEALGKTKDKEAVKPLANVVLSDSKEKVRLAAIEALDKIGDTSEYRAVISALSDSAPDVRSYAAELTGSWKISDGLPIITKMLKDDRSNTVRASCAHALGLYDNIATVSALIDALGDDYKDVRIYALESLKKISGQNYKFDKDAWRHWLEMNREK